MHRSAIVLVGLFISISVTAGEPSKFIKNLEAGKKQTLVVYGTSLTAGGPWVNQVADALSKKYPGLPKVINSGGSGKASDWALENLDKKVIGMKPDAVLIEFAVNDAVDRFHIAPEQARKNLETMIDRIETALPDCEIILQTMDPPIDVNLQKRPHIETYYQNYREVAKARNLRLIDHYPVWKKILDADVKHYKELVPDGIHPNAKGSETVTTPSVLAGLRGEVVTP